MDEEICSMNRFGVYAPVPKSEAQGRQIPGTRKVFKRKIQHRSYMSKISHFKKSVGAAVYSFFPIMLRAMRPHEYLDNGALTVLNSIIFYRKQDNLDLDTNPEGMMLHFLPIRIATNINSN